MAKKIKNSDIVDANLLGSVIKNAETLKERIVALQKVFKDTLKVQADFLKATKVVDFNSYKELLKTLKDVNKTTVDLVKTEKEKAVLEKEIERLNQVRIDSEIKSERLKQQSIKTQQAEVRLKRDLEKENARLIRQNTQNNNAYDQARLKLERLNKQYQALVVLQRENGKVGRALKQEIDSLNKTVTKAEHSVGNFRRNVGNYTSSIIDAATNTGIFGGEVGGAINMMRQSITSLGQMVGLLKSHNTETAVAAKNSGLLGSALNGLKGGGILALVAALGSLVAVLRKTEMGMEFLERQVAGIGGGFDAYIDLISTLSSGSFSDFLKKLNNISNSFSLARNAAIAYTDSLQKLEDLERERIVTRAEEGKQIAENRLNLEDEKKSIEEKLELIKETIRLDEESAANEIAFLTKRRDIMQNNMNDRQRLTPNAITDADRLALEEAKAAVINADTEAMMGRRRLASQKETLEIALANERFNRMKADREREIFLMQESADKEIETILLKYKEIERQAIKNKENMKLVEQNKLKEIADVREKYNKRRGGEDVERMGRSNSTPAELPESMQRQAEAVRQQAEELAEALKISNKKIEDEEKVHMEKMLELRKQFTDAAIEQILKEYDAKIRFQEKEIDRRRDNISEQTRLAENGSENQLAFEKKKLAEAEAEEKRLQKEKLKREKEIALFRLIAAYAEQGADGSAVLKASADMGAAKLISSFFWEGAENVDDALKGKGKAHNGRDGYRGLTKSGHVIGFDGKERIFNAEQNDLIGDISNDKAAQILYEHRLGEKEQKRDEADANLIMLASELRKINETMKQQKTINVNWESMDKRIVETVEYGMNKTVKHINARPKI